MNTIYVVRIDNNNQPETIEMRVDPRFIDMLAGLSPDVIKHDILNSIQDGSDETNYGGGWESNHSTYGIGYSKEKAINQIKEYAENAYSAEEINDINKALDSGLSDGDKAELRKNAGLE